MKQRGKAKIFLCYGKEDKDRVEEIYQKLDVAGYQPWMNNVDLTGAENWQDDIQEAVKASHFFVACISKLWEPDELKTGK